MYHALALLLVGVLSSTARSRLMTAAGGSFLLGIFLFSGSLYGLTLTGQRALGAITPLGGIAFLVGWLLLVLQFIRGIKAPR